MTTDRIVCTEFTECTVYTECTVCTNPTVCSVVTVCTECTYVCTYVPSTRYSVCIRMHPCSLVCISHASVYFHIILCFHMPHLHIRGPIFNTHMLHENTLGQKTLRRIGTAFDTAKLFRIQTNVADRPQIGEHHSFVCLQPQACLNDLLYSR